MAIIKRCKDCGIILCKDYYSPDYFKLFGKEKLHSLINSYGYYCKKCGFTHIINK